MSKENSVEVSENIDVVSDSEKKLRAGFEKVEEVAKAARSDWEKKQEDAGKEYMCNTCGKRFPSEKGAKMHLSGKNSTCDKSKGYKEVSKAVIEKSDREAFISKDDNAKKLNIAAEATKELRESARNSSNTNGRRITVVDLTRCPTPSLETMLKQADTVEIKKFISMRFHPANASRKFIAEKELAKRK